MILTVKDYLHHVHLLA